MTFSQQVRKVIAYAQLHRSFKQYFQVVPALTEDLVKEAQRIRHDVYCRELGWEPLRDDGLEKDDFDANSLHCLLRSVVNDRYIGCVRLVLPTEFDSGVMLPFQQTCLGGLDAGHPDAQDLKTGAVAEVSRLAIISDYRRRRDEQGKPVAVPAGQDFSHERRKFPFIPVGLYLGMMQMAKRHGIDTLYFLTEPVLARHFSMLGGKLVPVGQAIEHRGKRVPYVMKVSEVLGGASILLRPLIKEISREVDVQMNNHGQ